MYPGSQAKSYGVQIRGWKGFVGMGAGGYPIEPQGPILPPWEGGGGEASLTPHAKQLSLTHCMGGHSTPLLTSGKHIQLSQLGGRHFNYC